jgi:hypothetical protein
MPAASARHRCAISFLLTILEIDSNAARTKRLRAVLMVSSSNRHATNPLSINWWRSVANDAEYAGKRKQTRKEFFS